ncbi:MAG: ferritin family protein [Thermoplasmataceae archaeon]
MSVKTISGKNEAVIKDDILRKALRLKERISERYEDLYKRSSVDHVKLMLRRLQKNESNDRALILKAIKNGHFDEQSLKIERRDYEMMDHLIEADLDNINPNDLKSVMLSAMKMSKDFHHILDLMSLEYAGKELGNTLVILAKREVENKVRLEELYEEFVNKDYW